eukprot:tig00020563_g11338.t1
MDVDQTSIWNADPAAGPNGARLDTCTQLTHASWMVNQRAFQNAFTTSFWSPSTIARINAAGASFGYNLHASVATFPSRLSRTSAMPVTLSIENRGVEFALRTAAGSVAFSWPVDWDIRTVLPGPAVTFAASLGPVGTGVPGGSYTLSLRVVNPLANGFPLCFANAEQDGPWLSIESLSLA